MILEHTIHIRIEPREDGGINVEGPDGMGLILSGSDPEKIMAAVWPAIVALAEYRAAHPRLVTEQRG